jgi:hypothetical protein
VIWLGILIVSTGVIAFAVVIGKCISLGAGGFSSPIQIEPVEVDQLMAEIEDYLKDCRGQR